MTVVCSACSELLLIVAALCTFVVRSCTVISSVLFAVLVNLFLCYGFVCSFRNLHPTGGDAATFDLVFFFVSRSLCASSVIMYYV